MCLLSYILLGDEAIPNPKSGLVYKPKSKIIQKLEEKSRKEKNVERVFLAPIPASTKPAVSSGLGSSWF